MPLNCNRYLLPRVHLAPIIADLTASEVFDSPMLQFVYSVMPEFTKELEKAATDLEAFADWLGRWKKELLDLFGDVPAVINDGNKKARFVTLPFSAVLEWLQADALKVHSEDCVVFLLNDWVKANSAATGHDELQQLAKNVRVLRLSPIYRNSVLRSLGWFNNVLSPEDQGSLVTLQCLPRQLANGTGSLQPWKGPPAWIASDRTIISGPLTMTLDMGPDQFQQLDDNPPGWHCSSPVVYRNGFKQFLYSQKIPVEGGKFTLGVFVSVDKEDSLGETFHIDGTLRIDSRRDIKIERYGHLTLDKATTGRKDFITRSGRTIREVVAPYLVGERLKISYTLADRKVMTLTF